MGFSFAQLKKLTGKLDRRHVQTRKLDDKDIDYIEGWFAIAEANAIFGFGGWDREMTHFERIFERTRGEVTTCVYTARVKISVRAGATPIIREGSGIGSASCKNASDAHERAIKAAETDATKRALATFGNRFGLSLYDKEQVGVTPRPSNGAFTIRDDAGREVATDVSAEAFCSGLRQVIQLLSSQEEIEKCRSYNVDEIARLRVLAPKLRSNRGDHFADILGRLFDARLKPVTIPVTEALECNGDVTEACDKKDETHLNPPQLDKQATQILSRSRIDKTMLPIAVPRRMRDKDHIRNVGTLPCLVCEQTPSHAHHLTYAQHRGLALKVSDEFVVPLCVIHHNELHRSGAEELWWKRLNIEPLQAAQTLWEKHLHIRGGGAAQVA